MSYMALSIQERLAVASQAITNALNDTTLGELLAFRSYTLEKLTAGHELYQKTFSLQGKQTNEYGEAVEASENYEKAWRELLDEMRDIRVIGKIEFQNNKRYYKELKLHKPLIRTKLKGREALKELLTHIAKTPEIVNALTPYGITQETISDMKGRSFGLETLITNRDQEKTEAQNATRERDKAMEALDEWMIDFLTIARIAVKNNPEYMEMLGEIVPS